MYVKPNKGMPLEDHWKEVAHSERALNKTLSERIAKLLERVSSLTKERQEMVEALRKSLPYVNDCARVYSHHKAVIIAEEIESLLSKFEVPNT